MPLLRRQALWALLGVVAFALVGAPACGPLGGGCKRLGCANGRVCNEATDQCEPGPPGTGGSGEAGGTSGPAGGRAGGAATAGGGSSGGVAGGGLGVAGGVSGTAGGAAPTPDGGYPNCLRRAQSELTCTSACPMGFRCVSGLCRLNGGASYLQATLRWDTSEDLDLHVIEPLLDAGTCRVDFSNPNSGSQPSTCGARGSLDLDSEAACRRDGIDIENIIYPAAGTLVPGTYRVLVNHYANCDAGTTYVPYQLEVRKGADLIGVCGVYRPTDPDWGDDTDRVVLTVTVP
ncbi:MAG: hypothetical protein JNK82_37215 [Myxococcaceae bacterium]|nr:hypothetical protein [Myxococcaceae bacterium]